MNKNYCIYKHTNKINHKVYIGMTNNPERRWANNGKEYEQFANCVFKYDVENTETTL